MSQMIGKYLGSKALRQIKYLRKCKDYKIATTNGCFDLLHAGHVYLLRNCLKKPEIPEKTALIVLINDDASVKAIKGPGRPVYGEDHRLYMVRSIKGVTAAFLFSGTTPEEALKSIRPDFHFKGVEWEGRDVPEKDYVGTMFYEPHLIDVSTTTTIEKIQYDVPSV